jgi:hypothetical protein
MSEEKNDVNPNKLFGGAPVCTNLVITPNAILSAYDSPALENVYQIFRNVVKCSLFQSMCNDAGILARKTIIPDDNYICVYYCFRDRIIFLCCAAPIFHKNSYYTFF